MTLAGVMFDEVALMPRSFVEQACARCSVPGSKYWFNCNPSSPEHWFYKEWVKKHKEKNALRLHFTMDDNLALDASIKARYESMYSGVFYQRYIKGLWVLAEGVIYQAFTTESITSLDACATRLRVELKSLKGIDKNSFVAMGASGVIEVGNGLHIVFGTQAASIKEQVKAVMEGKAVVKPDGKKKIRKAANNTNEEIISPMSGRIMKLSDTPDETFASGMLGIGFAIEPDAPEVVSPIDGQITSVFPTKHAICIESDKGEKIMLHLGIDTVKLEGKPFDVQVKEGDKIKAGELLAQIDLEEIKKASSIISPIVFIDKSDYEIILNKSGNVKAGDKGIVSFRKK